MNLGFASEIINPEVEVELSGYGWFLGRKATGIQDDIFAHAVYLEDESNAALLISCDLLALSQYEVNAVRGALVQRTGLKGDQIILSSTHTHTAPASAQTIGCGEVNWDYVDMLITRMIVAGEKAVQSARRVTGIRQGKMEIEPIGYNRADPQGPLDPNVYFAEFEIEQEQPVVVINYACHPVTLGPISEVSPDYPGDVVKIMEQRGCRAMFLNGCCGDIDPVVFQGQWGSGTKETIHTYAVRLCDAVTQGLAQSPILPCPPIETDTFTFQLETEQYDWASLTRMCEERSRTYEWKDGDLGYREWLKQMKRFIMNDKKPFEEEVRVSMVRLGSLILIAGQGELYTQIGADVRKSFPESLILFDEDADAALRYVADETDMARRDYGGMHSNVVYAKLPLTLDAAKTYSNAIIERIRLWNR